MSQLKSRRKQDKDSRPNLRLVPNAKPKRRTRRRFKLGALRRVYKSKYTPELLAYEEEVVLGALKEMGGRASVRGMTSRWPGRFRTKQLWWTLIRLQGQGRVHGSLRGVLRHTQGDIYEGAGWLSALRPWFERHKPDAFREFWL